MIYVSAEAVFDRSACVVSIKDILKALDKTRITPAVQLKIPQVLCFTPGNSPAIVVSPDLLTHTSSRINQVK